METYNQYLHGSCGAVCVWMCVISLYLLTHFLFVFVSLFEFRQRNLSELNSEILDVLKDVTISMC